jgi:predicted nucleic acid-binding protein
MQAIHARHESLRDCPVEPLVWRRARWVLERLPVERGGRHRGVTPADAIIAAAAEARGLPVLHRDRHFELIASVTGRQTRRLGPPPP